VSIAISWAFNAAVTNGPTISLANDPPISVDAYDLVTTTLAASSVGKIVNLQPSATAGDVVLIALKSDAYDKTVLYDAGGGKQNLDGPVLLVGAGAVALLGTTPPKSLTFDNGLAKKVTVQVLVGRKA
jgi:hypothetical protein